MSPSSTTSGLRDKGRAIHNLYADRVTSISRDSLIRRTLMLGWFTIYNVGEGAIAISAAVVAGSDALLSFGHDSAVESVRQGTEALHAENADACC